MKPSLILSLAILLFFASCSKHNNPDSPVTPPTNPPTPVTMKINLTTSAPNEEIIFSDSGGKVLLDTMSPFPSPLVATLQTAQNLIDIALVTYDTSQSNYQVVAYKAINPSKWSSLEGTGYYHNFYPRLSNPVYIGPVIFKNTPSVSTDYAMVSDYVSSLSASESVPAPGYLEVFYPQAVPTNYTYLVLPSTGLCNFHIPPPGMQPDTVDLAVMDTAVTINFTLPAGYSLDNVSLYGIVDTTDLSKSLYLYNKIAGQPIPDLEYPQKIVQEMECYVSTSYVGGGGGGAAYYSYGKSIPSNLPFPDPSSFSITASQGNSFSFSFSSGNPSYYNTQWSNTKIYLSLFAPGDSTNFNPQGFLTALNSRLLQGQDFSTLKIVNYDFTLLTGMDYSGLVNLEHNPAQLNTQHVASAIDILKSY
jgi:hypothetical protein